MPQAMCEMGPVGLNRNLLVNREVPPFDNPDLRHAMALSLDRQAFIEGRRRRGDRNWAVSTSRLRVFRR